MSLPIRLALVSTLFPWPLDRGDPLRVAVLLRECIGLAKSNGWVARPLIIRRADTLPSDIAALEEFLGTSLEVFDRDRGPASKAERAALWARGLVDGTPGWITERYSTALASRLSELRPNVAVLFGEPAGSYSTASPGMTVWDKGNVLGASSWDFDHDRPLRRRITTHVSKRFEARVLRSVDRVVVTSPEEEGRLRTLYLRGSDAVVPSVLPLEAVGASPWQPTDRLIGWMSSLDYKPNTDGLMRFLDGPWPTLAAGGWRLEVAGAGQPDAGVAAAIRRSHNVVYRGFVPDLGTWLSGLHLGVVPLWAGAGVKLKTLAFLAAGVPTWGTPVAFEGLPVQDGVHALIESDLGQVAARLQGFAALPCERQRALSEAAMSLVADGFTPGAIAGTYGRHLTRWVGELD